MNEYARIASPLVTQSVDRSIAALRWVGFWSAVALPFLHVPLLAVEGFTGASAPVILALWLANAAALVVGRDHAPRGRRQESPERARA
jgi:hypothetical protein